MPRLTIRVCFMSISLFLSIQTFANTFHLSPDIRLGPYAGAGISGMGLQLGVRKALNLESIYLSYSETNAEFLYMQEDSLKTYRLGGELLLGQSPIHSLQVELGYVTYVGNREYIFGESRTLEQDGISSSVSWVVEYNNYLSLRAGMELHFLDKSSTFLGVSLVPAFSTGVVVKF